MSQSDISHNAMIEVITAGPQHQTLWKTYVACHPQATPYHDFAWASSVQGAYKHRNSSLLALQTSENGQQHVVGVLPAVSMHIPLVGSKLCSLPFCDVGYALADSDTIRDSLIATLKSQHPDTPIEYRDSAQASSAEPLPGRKVRMVLALPESAEALMAGFKSKLRSQIRKAEKNGLHCEVGSNQVLLDHFYQVFIHNMRKLGSPVHSKQWFQCLFNGYQDKMLLSVVYQDTTPIGAGIVLLQQHKACIPWASTLADYNKLAPNMLLYWSLLEHLSDNGYQQFDFGRSTFGEGTYKFKQQWGAEPVALRWQLPDDNQSEIELESSAEPSKLRSSVESIWCRLPIGLTTWLGPKIRKYISL
jgi:FemAB-related protein (PEP-CTERM system-associated)